MMTPFNPDTDLERVRHLAAPPALVWRWSGAGLALVWRCWTEAALLVQWFAPRPVITRGAVIDARAGGRCCTVLVMPDGAEHAGDGCILEAVPQQRLVLTDLMEPGFRPAGAPSLGFTAIIELAAEGAGTRSVARALHRSATVSKQHADTGFHDGWGTATTHLEEVALRLMA